MTANAEKGITTDTLSRSTRSIPEIDIVHMMVGADFLRQTGQWNCAGSAGQVGTTKTVGELQHDREPLAGFGKASEIWSLEWTVAFGARNVSVNSWAKVLSEMKFDVLIRRVFHTKDHAS